MQFAFFPRFFPVLQNEPMQPGRDIRGDAGVSADSPEAGEATRYLNRA